jgi:hypothetical protein
MAETDYHLQGLGGGVILDGSGGSQIYSGHSRGILVINDAVLSTLAAEGWPNISLIEGATLPAGLFIPGEFTAITVTSGIVAVPTKTGTPQLT